MNSGRVVFMNGEFVPEEEARISIYDSALMFGDMVFEMTDHYFGQNYELAPWDTWVWREGNYLVSWVPVWMKERLNTGIVSESAGANSWLRVNYDNCLEIVGFSESGL